MTTTSYGRGTSALQLCWYSYRFRENNPKRGSHHELGVCLRREARCMSLANYDCASAVLSKNSFSNCSSMAGSSHPAEHHMCTASEAVAAGQLCAAQTGTLRCLTGSSGRMMSSRMCCKSLAIIAEKLLAVEPSAWRYAGPQNCQATATQPPGLTGASPTPAKAVSLVQPLTVPARLLQRPVALQSSSI